MFSIDYDGCGSLLSFFECFYQAKVLCLHMALHVTLSFGFIFIVASSNLTSSKKVFNATEG